MTLRGRHGGLLISTHTPAIDSHSHRKNMISRGGIARDALRRVNGILCTRFTE
jgi:hypothetical protein